MRGGNPKLIILQGGPKYVHCWNLRGILTNLTHLILRLMALTLVILDGICRPQRCPKSWKVALPQSKRALLEATHLTSSSWKQRGKACTRCLMPWAMILLPVNL